MAVNAANPTRIIVLTMIDDVMTMLYTPLMTQTMTNEAIKTELQAMQTTGAWRVQRETETEMWLEVSRWDGCDWIMRGRVESAASVRALAVDLGVAQLEEVAS